MSESSLIEIGQCFGPEETAAMLHAYADAVSRLEKIIIVDAEVKQKVAHTILQAAREHGADSEMLAQAAVQRFL
jgi:hypothetical protein